ncbi:MAG: 5-oxoprolinase subunit PxpA [Dermatophilaceae bacterium]
MSRMRVDLNADVGESFGQWRLGDDASLAPHLSSMNVACGFHAGGPLTMTATIRLAREHSLAVGAHVGYRDLAGFGRRFLDVDPAELCAEVRYQVGALQAVAAGEGVEVTYCKPHGALYDAILRHEAQARAVAEALAGWARPLTLLGLPGSAALRIADDLGVPTAREAFCDRAYTAQGTLVPRGQRGAVVHDLDAVVTRVVRMVTDGSVVAIDGTEVSVNADSLCVHGDSPGAVALARAVRAALDEAGVTVEPFAPGMPR